MAESNGAKRSKLDDESVNNRVSFFKTNNNYINMT